MANYKTTWFFEGLQSATRGASSIVGWTETWYQANNGGLDAALANALAPAGWLGERLPFLCTNYRAVWARVSDTANPRNTKVAAIANGEGQATASAAQVTCCALIDVVRLPSTAPIVDTKAHHRRLLLRGLPTQMITGNVFNVNTHYYNLMRQFLNYVAVTETPNFPALVQINPPVPYWLMQFEPSSQVQYGLTALAVSLPGNKQLTVSGAFPAIAAGQKVKITKVGFPRSCNRIWTAVGAAAAGGPLQLGYSRVELAGVWDGVNGLLQVQAPAYGAANQYTIIGLTSRHTGRPFRLTRGKRSVGSSLL